MKTDIINRLTAYYHLYKKLDRIGGPEEDGDLFEEVIGTEEEILEKFGLPLSNKNKSILWKLVNKHKLSEKNLLQTFKHLQAAAERFLYSPVQTDLEQLIAAKGQKRSAFDILPELGRPTHEYTIFLYDVILDFANPEDVLAELSALKRLGCYGEAASLKNQYPRTFRKTKVYKQLSPYLKFLDNYLDPSNFELLFRLNDEDDESMPHPLEMARVISFKDFENECSNREAADLFSIARPEPVDFEPKYIILSDLIEIEEIIFSEDSAVTVTGQLYECYKPSPITLGFDFDTLTAVIRGYGSIGQYILNYFNKSRQQNLTGIPTIISLKDKVGSNLELTQHYFKAYKPLTLGANGKHEVMKEAFYIIEEIIDKAHYDQQQVVHMKSGLKGTFHHISQHYYFYLNHMRNGLSEEEARIKAELQDKVRFEIARMLYYLEKHGGRAEMK